MKVAFLTTDNREHHRRYELTTPYFGTAPEALLQGMGMLPELQVHVIACTQKAMASPPKLAENIWFHSLLVPKIGWMRTAYQGCIRKTRKFLAELQPDIVHGQGTERDCAIAAVFSGFPNLITIHGNMRLIAKVTHAPVLSYQWLAAQLERLTIPQSNGIVCITQYTKEAVRNLAPRTWVVPNAVDQDFFGIERKPQEDPAIILCVGEITARKNQNMFIQALDQLVEEANFKLVFLGQVEGSYGVTFRCLIEARPWCEHVGFVNRDQLKPWLARAALLALPSIEDNCPMAILEAMAAGVPVIAARVGGVPDLIQDEVTGLLFDPNSAASIRAAVETSLQNRARSGALAERAKREAWKRFHPREVAQQHVQIYDDVLRTRS